MSRPTSGEGGSGAVVVYELGGAETAMLETLSFTVTTDGTAGTHAVRLVLTLPGQGIVGRFDDLNVGGPTQVNGYTYGLGLNASACTLPDGIDVTDALPWTTLPPGATIELIAINGSGVEIPGDTFSEVFLMLGGEIEQPPQPSNIPITLLPAQAAA